MIYTWRKTWQYFWDPFYWCFVRCTFCCVVDDDEMTMMLVWKLLLLLLLWFLLACYLQSKKLLCTSRTLINQIGTRPSNQLNVSISRVFAFRQKGGNAFPGMSTGPSNQRPFNLSSRCWCLRAINTTIKTDIWKHIMETKCILIENLIYIQTWFTRNVIRETTNYPRLIHTGTEPLWQKQIFPLIL